jgi:hypothetical protein
MSPLRGWLSSAPKVSSPGAAISNRQLENKLFGVNKR